MVEVLETYYNPKQQALAIPMLVGTPTLGHVRIEWADARDAMVKPANFVISTQTVVNYPTHVGQNIMATKVIRENYRALLLLEDDNKAPADLILRMADWWERMERREAPPFVSGLYYIKGSFERDLGPEPMVYRGPGMRSFRDFIPGEDVIEVDGAPTGCCLIHADLLKAYAAEPDIPQETLPGVPYPVFKIFDRPQLAYTDAAGNSKAYGATSDLWFAGEVIRRGLLEKAGWGKWAKKPFPYLVDTRICSDHLDRQTGRGQDWAAIRRVAEKRCATDPGKTARKKARYPGV